MTIEKIYLGYWYQRTTLHLSELYDFLHNGESPLKLDHKKLTTLRSDLEIESVEFRLDMLESLVMTTKSGIDITLYEDGLVVFRRDHSELRSDIQKLTHYFETRFSPAVSYLFSLGAPVPKELAGIKTISPFFITMRGASHDNIAKLLGELNEDRYYEITTDDVAIYRGNQFFLINHAPHFKGLEPLIEAQIFFKEFKTQLHHYLNLHRTIWEKIAAIKEQGAIKGQAVQAERNELEGYKKTVELIEGRMNQMGIHITTRESVIQSLGLEDVLSHTLQSRYQNLKETLNYVKTLWSMTSRYVDSAIQIFNEIGNQSTKNSIQALTLITTLGLLNGIIGYFTLKQYPVFTLVGLSYFVLLIAATWVVNQIVVLSYRKMKYKITAIEANRHIK
jgi:hypothetical protein